MPPAPPAPPLRGEGSRRAIGCLSFLLFLSSVPLGVLGLLFYSESRDSSAATPLSGLTAVGVIVGVVIMAAAVVALVAGAVVFVRSAKD